MVFEGDEFLLRLNKFLENHGHEYSNLEEAMDAFRETYDGPITMDAMDNFQDFDEMDSWEDSPAMQSMEIYEEAMQSGTMKGMRKLLYEAVRIWPENIDATAALIEIDFEKDGPVVYLQELEGYFQEQQEIWTSKDLDSWYNYDERPYWRLCYRMADAYKEAGRLLSARDVFDDILQYNESDPLGVRHELIAIYCKLYDWENALDLVNLYDINGVDDQLLIPLLILAILTGRDEKAAELYKSIVSVNPGFTQLFNPKSEQFNFDVILSTAFRDAYEPRSLESAAVALERLMTLIYPNNYVYKWLLEESKHVKPKRKANKKAPKAKNDKVIPLPFVKKAVEDSAEDDADPWHILSLNQQISLEDASIYSIDDLEKLSQTEFLRFHGIGQSTLKKLLDAGVTFRED